jgi:RHS repeat-associated protein
VAVVSLAAQVAAAPSALDPTSVGASGAQAPSAGSVSARTGSAAASFAFELPPGRGVGPQLALVYSSQGAERGDIAAGWGLTVPGVRYDVRRQAYLANGTELQPAPADTTSYGGAPFRGHVDRDGARYELANGAFYVSTPNGSVLRLEELLPNDWRVVSIQDVWGNEARYSWWPVPLGGRIVDFVLTDIEYSANTAAGVVAGAAVHLSYDRDPPVCAQPADASAVPVPVGAALTYETGSLRVSGAWPLVDLYARVNDNGSWRDVRHWHLDYNYWVNPSIAASDYNPETGTSPTIPHCDGPSSPRRFLVAITDGPKPPVTYRYGALPYTSPMVHVTPPQELAERRNCDTSYLGGTWYIAGYQQILADLDGDGRVDIVSAGDGCQAQWRDSKTSALKGSFGLPSTGGKLPSVPGAFPAPGCALDGAWGVSALYPSSADGLGLDYRLVDLDGDSRLDLVAAGSWEPDVQLPAASGPAPLCGNPSSSCLASGNCPLVPCSTLPGGLDGAASRLPMHGPAPAKPCGSGAYWLVYRDIATGTAQPEAWCAPIGLGPASGHSLFDFVDMNADGKPDVVVASLVDGQCSRVALNVFYSDGAGHFTDSRVLALPDWPPGGDCKDAQPLWNALVDVNHDGLPDFVHEYDEADGTQTLYVAYNRGDRFESYPVTLARGLQGVFPPRQGPSPTACQTTQGNFFKDLDGDGIPDLACADPARCDTSHRGVALGSGGGFAPLTRAWDTSRVVQSWSGTQGDPRQNVTQDFFDWTGDGIADQSFYDPNVWRPSDDEAPGLLVEVRNGIGGSLRFRYGHSSDTGLVTRNQSAPAYAAGWADWVRPAFPLSAWLVKQIDVSDGQTTTSTRYHYTDPAFVPENVTLAAPGVPAASGERPLFRGFQAVRTVSQPAATGEYTETLERTSYVKDPAGLVDYRAVMAHPLVPGAGGEPVVSPRPVKHTVDTTTYVVEAVLSASSGIRFVHPQSSVHIDCDASTDLGACDRQTVHRTTTATTFVSELGGKLWLPEDVRIDTTTFDGRPLMRETFTNMLVQDRPYLALPKRQVRSGTVPDPNVRPPGPAAAAARTPAAVPPTPQTYAREEFFYDGSASVDSCGSAFGSCRGALTKHRVYRDLGAVQFNGPVCTDANLCSDEGLWYDATGNPTRSMGPSQMVRAGGDPSSTAVAASEVFYDPLHVFPVRTRNALGQEITRTFDSALGVVLTEAGPNTSPNVPPPPPKGAVVPPPPPCSSSPCVVAQETRRYHYDGLGRLTGVEVPKDDASGYAMVSVYSAYYPSLTEIYEWSSLDWNQTLFAGSHRVYDGLGRLRTAQASLNGRDFTAPGTPSTTYEYDGRGLLASVATPHPMDLDPVTTRYGYDALGRMTQVTAPDGTIRSVSYAPWEKTVFQPGNRVVHQSYDGLGQLRGADESGTDVSASTLYDYDVAGRVHHVLDPDLHETLLDHDGQGNRTRVTRPGGKAWVYGYDIDGQLARALDPDGRVTTYAYDVLGRITDEFADPRLDTDPARAAALAAQLGIGQTHYTYDAALATGRPELSGNLVGRLSAIELYAGRNYATFTFGYDAQGHSARESLWVDLPGIANRTLATTHESGPSGAPFGETYPNGQRATFAYAGGGRLDHVSAAGLELARFTYSAAGPLRSVAALTGSGLPLQTRQLTYDLLGRTTQESLTVATPAPQSLTRTYHYLADDNIESIDLDDRLADGTLQNTLTLDYDGLQRIKTASLPALVAAAGRLPASYQAGLTYSPAGNVLVSTILGAQGLPARSGITYTYDTTGADSDVQAVQTLVAADGNHVADLAYDRSGNVKERRVPGFADLQTRFLYDTHDQIRQVSHLGAASTAATEQYFYSGKSRFLAIDSNGDWRLSFGAFVLEHQGATEKASAYVAGARLTTTNCTGSCPVEVTLLHADRRGDLLAAVDQTGQLRGHFVYGAFGETLYQYDPAQQWNYRVNGTELDRVSGLSYYGHRHYDPLTLRWTSADPLFRSSPDAGLGSTQRPNLYAFTLNNPLHFADPDGLDPWHDSTSNGGGSYGAGDFFDWLGAGLGTIWDWITADGGRSNGAGTYRPTSRLISQQDWLSYDDATHSGSALGFGAFAAKNIGIGAWSGAKGIGSGLWITVRHPIQTLEGLESLKDQLLFGASFAYAKGGVAEVASRGIGFIKGKVDGAVDTCKTDLGACFQGIGNAAVQIGSFIVPGAIAGKVGRLAGAAGEGSVILYHGTTASAAARIIANGFRLGVDGSVYFAEDFATAAHFAREAMAARGALGGTVIKLSVPAEVAAGLERGVLGAARGVSPIGIAGSSGYELILSADGIGAFNAAMREGAIQAVRWRLKL